MSEGHGLFETSSHRVRRKVANQAGPSSDGAMSSTTDLPTAILDPEVKYTQLYINGQFVNAENGKTFVTFNPSTDKKICDVQEAGKVDVDRAVSAARAAFKLGSPWRKMEASERGRLMYRLADLIQSEVAYLASIETMDSGKPYQLTVLDVQSSARVLRYYAGLADKIHGRTIPTDGEFFTYTYYEPVGVCGQIIPCNYPLMLACVKLAPALATGCVVILKPAEQTPLSALYLAQLSKDAGFPDGVINVVTGHAETGAMIAGHMDIDKVSFTGSTENGKLVMEAAGKSNCKRLTLEMGGKSPLIVAEDADLDLAAEIGHDAVMSNAGQCCIAASRLFVHEKIYDDFCRKSVELAKDCTVGDPFKCPDMGPLIDEDLTNRVLEMIEFTKQEGARLLYGGKRARGPSKQFVEPTVFADVTDDMLIAREEILGPIQQIFKYKTLDEAIERANNTRYGLAAGIVSTDINTIQKFAHEIRAGVVWVNTYLAVAPQVPVGGVKMSGMNRESGFEGILPYCELKTVMMKVQDQPM